MMRLALVPTPKPSWKGSIQDIVAWLEGRQVALAMPQDAAAMIGRPDLGRPGSACFQGADAVLSLGGDGTLLRAARSLVDLDLPILGINLGGLGFLTEVPFAEYPQALEALLAGQYQVESRMRLECRILREGATVWQALALNDAVIERGYDPRILHLNVDIGGRHGGDLVADGLIISSPTGSTAYSLSAGGPIVSPAVDCLILTAICPHTLSWRPLVIAPQETITVEETARQPMSLSVDGVRAPDLTPGDQVQVLQAAQRIRFVRIRRDFYQILREKLNWVEREGNPVAEP